MIDPAALLRRARQGAGLTQSELARRAGVTQSVISAYESRRREPALTTLARLVEAAGSRLHLDVVPAAGGVSAALPATPRGKLIQRRRRQIIRAAARHGASDVRLFGSSARGEDRPDSDIDLLVHVEPGVGLLGLARLQRDLEEILGSPVDLVPDDSVKPDARGSVERDMVALRAGPRRTGSRTSCARARRSSGTGSRPGARPVR